MTQQRNNLGKPRRGTRYSVEFPTMPSLRQKAAYIEIIQKQYHHDIATINFVRSSEVWFKEIPTGLPVKITWSQRGLTRTWVGYVSHVERSIKAELNQPMAVHCVGASYPLKERATRMFTNMTIPEAAKIIATEFGLNLVADSHPTRFPQLTMAGHSYWQWLVEHAKKIGYTLYVDGANLHLERLDRTINSKVSSSALLFTTNKYVPSTTNYFEKTLRSFKVLKGDNVETGREYRAVKTASGVNPLTTSTATSSSSPSSVGIPLRDQSSEVLFQEYRTDQVVQSLQMAQQLSTGAANMARFNLPAKVKCSGDPRMSPFAPVRVKGTGPKTDGLWVVDEVRHNIRSNGEYDIEALILTDGTGPNADTRVREEVHGQRGTVDIAEALRNRNRRGATAAPVLSGGALPVRSADSGFTKDKARWRAGGITSA